MLFRKTCNKLTKFTAHRSVKQDHTINLGSVFVSDNPMPILSVEQFSHLFLQLLSSRRGKNYTENTPNTCKRKSIKSAKFLLHTTSIKLLKF